MLFFCHYSHQLSLYRRKCHNAYDILPGTPSGQVVNRFCDTLKHRSISFRLCQTLHQFVTDIAAVQIREYKNVRLARHFASGRLGLRNGRNDSGVCLKLTIQRQSGILFMSYLNCFYNLINKRMFRASFGGMESIAMIGFAPTSVLKLFALVSAIAASSSAVGS